MHAGVPTPRRCVGTPASRRPLLVGANADGGVERERRQTDRDQAAIASHKTYVSSVGKTHLRQFPACPGCVTSKTA